MFYVLSMSVWYWAPNSIISFLYSAQLSFLFLIPASHISRIIRTCTFFARYVKSRSDKQLRYGLQYNDTSSCIPEESNDGLPIVPCGLISWSLFNDTYSFFRGTDELRINRKNIAWKSDRDHKFGKHVFPFNFQNGTLIGGAMLDPNVPVRVPYNRLYELKMSHTYLSCHLIQHK